MVDLLARTMPAQEVLMQWWHQDGAVADWQASRVLSLSATRSRTALPPLAQR
jgi:hypothetical protein